MKSVDYELDAWLARQQPVPPGYKVDLFPGSWYPPLYVLLMALFHQCRLVLHASIVPFFSGTAIAAFPHEVIVASVGHVIDSALSLSILAMNLKSHDLSGQAPFVGYCLYTAIIILNKLDFSTHDEKLRINAKDKVVYPQKALEGMKIYWKHLDKLVSLWCLHCNILRLNMSVGSYKIHCGE